jgi:hypothetical protein
MQASVTEPSAPFERGISPRLASREPQAALFDTVQHCLVVVGLHEDRPMLTQLTCSLRAARCQDSRTSPR